MRERLRVVTVVNKGRSELAFAEDATRESVAALVGEIKDGMKLWFYDEAFESPSDPGAFVTLVRSDDLLLAQWNNHGWGAGWIRLSESQAARYLWACRAENTIGARNAIGYLGIRLGQADKIPAPPEDESSLMYLHDYVSARIAGYKTR